MNHKKMLQAHNRRRVLELKAQGVPVATILRRLGVSRSWYESVVRKDRNVDKG